VDFKPGYEKESIEKAAEEFAAGELKKEIPISVLKGSRRGKPCIASRRIPCKK
jgi:hypothetical protein